MTTSSPAARIVLEYVCPSLGILTANSMWIAPIRSVQSANARGHLGQLNPTPWAFMTGNCAGWVCYSYLIRNQFVFWANWPGFIISVWLNLCAAKLQYQGHCAAEMRKSFVRFIDENRASIVSASPVAEEENEARPGRSPGGWSAKSGGGGGGGLQLADTARMVLQVTTQQIRAPAPHEKIVVSMFLFWLLVASVVAFLEAPPETKTLIVGLAVNCNLVFFYGAPLSTIFRVLRERNAASIHVPTMLTNTANGAFWTSYGWAVWDLYIAIPNGLGALLGCTQILFVIVFPRKKADDAGESIPDWEVGKGASEAVGKGASEANLVEMGSGQGEGTIGCEGVTNEAADIEAGKSEETNATPESR